MQLVKFRARYFPARGKIKKKIKINRNNSLKTTASSRVKPRAVVTVTGKP